MYESCIAAFIDLSIFKQEIYMHMLASNLYQLILLSAASECLSTFNPFVSQRIKISDIRNRLRSKIAN